MLNPKAPELNQKTWPKEALIRGVPATAQIRLSVRAGWGRFVGKLRWRRPNKLKNSLPQKTQKTHKAWSFGPDGWGLLRILW
jgi:hypothetical protein